MFDIKSGSIDNGGIQNEKTFDVFCGFDNTAIAFPGTGGQYE